MPNSHDSLIDHKIIIRGNERKKLFKLYLNKEYYKGSNWAIKIDSCHIAFQNRGVSRVIKITCNQIRKEFNFSQRGNVPPFYHSNPDEKQTLMTFLFDYPNGEELYGEHFHACSTDFFPINLPSDVLTFTLHEVFDRDSHRNHFLFYINMNWSFLEVSFIKIPRH